MRIRSIKPEFWRSEDVTSLSVEDRLLFIGLWSYVDDSGVGRDELHAICGDLFAGDLVASPRETVARVQRGLEHLAAVSLITRYSVAGKNYLAVTGWKAHQKIDRPSPARFPGPDQAERVSTTPIFASPREDSRGLDAGTGEQGNRRTGEQSQSSPIGTSPRGAVDNDGDGLDSRARIFNFDGHRVRAELTKVLGEFPDADTVMRVATGVLKKAARPADDPTAYIVGAIRKSEFEIQKLAHGEAS